MPRVLIVDDSRTIRMDLDEAFGSIGFERTLASTLAEAGAALRTQAFDLLVLDVILPDGDGIDFLGQLRASAAAVPPVMLLSTEREVGHRIRGLLQGADEYVGKPYDVESLLQRARELAARARPAKKRAAGPEETPVRVLAVDDSATFLDALCTFLEEGGWHVRTARSGEEGLQRLREAAYDCVVLDLTMPGLSGMDTLRRLRELPASRDVPVVLLTAHDDAPTAIAALRAGADDFVTKSADLELLQARVQAMLRRRDLERENARAVEERARAQVEAAQASAARELAELRGRLLADLESKNAQIERESLYKSRFLASISHELRTPLNVIIGCSDLLEREGAGALTPGQREYVRSVLHGGRHLLAIVNDILDLSKVTAGKMVLRPEWTPPGTVLAAARSVAAQLAERQGITLTMDAPSDLPDVWADPLRMKQVLVNLLSNAVKFTPGGGKVHLAGRFASGHLELSVEDTGIGIAEEDLPRLFREFEQINPGGVNKPQGTGLGLALSRRLVELHGGSLSARSAVGVGSTFVARFPVRRPPPEASPPHVVVQGAPHAGQAGAAAGASESVNLCAAHMRALGLPVALAADGPDARRLARELDSRARIVAVSADGHTPLATLDGGDGPVVVVARWDERHLLASVRAVVPASVAADALASLVGGRPSRLLAVGPHAGALLDALPPGVYTRAVPGGDPSVDVLVADVVAPGAAAMVLVAPVIDAAALAALARAQELSNG